MPETIICGLDIGSTKVCAVIGEVDDQGNVDIIGIGKSISFGLRKGVVINIDTTVHSVENAIKEAQLMAGVKIESLFAGISGSHITGINSESRISIPTSNKRITATDVERVIESAKPTSSIPPDRQIIHTIPQKFSLDDQDQIDNPIDMIGTRLGVEVHVITSGISPTQNLVQSIEKTGVKIDKLAFSPLAGATSVLNEDEKNLGVAMVDIGGGTTDIVIFINGSIWHSSVIGIGGMNISNDIAVGLRTPLNAAEKLKIDYGCALRSLIEQDEQIEITGVGGGPSKTVSREILVSLIEPRVEELMELIKTNIQNSGREDLIPAGVVLTGGTSQLLGIGEVASEILDLPVRIGYPKKVGGLSDIINNPIYSTGVGLVLWGNEYRRNGGGKIGGKGTANVTVGEKVKGFFKKLLGE
ncbi:MAG: cell division protein FtsA [bacterium]|nr:cell division protein FtsA [bacterium]